MNAPSNMPSVSAIVELITQLRPTLTVTWRGDYLSSRAHNAHLYRVAAYVEELSRRAGGSWVLYVDARSGQIALDLLKPGDDEVQLAMRVLGEVARRVNDHGADVR